jgi:MYXO-CTERM domain-containing protein
MRRLRVAAAFTLLAAGAPGAAYERSASDAGVPLAWGTLLVPYSANPSHPYACPAGPGGDPLLAAVSASFEAWRPACPSGERSGLELLDAGPLDEIRIGMGGTSENLVVFRQGWCRQVLAEADPRPPCLDDPDVDCGGLYNCFEDATDADRFTLALTSVLYYPDTGRIVDADVEMNGWDGDGPGQPIVVGTAPPLHGWYFTCEDPATLPECRNYGDADCIYADVQNTLTHEVGHFIGLRHVCDGGGAADADLPPCGGDDAEITMYPLTQPGDVEKRTLHPDDVAGVCAVYPASDDGGGCGCGAGGSPGALALVVLGAAARWPRRRRAPRR